ncbi:MAG: sensor histidine kinase [Chitinophagaceae bacterium]|nr:sensor histidine kinase [Chitinophagaceae bacterium]
MWNEAAEDILNVKATDILGKDLLNYPTLFTGYPKPTITSFNNHLKRALQERITVNAENYVAFKEKWFDVRLQPYQEGLLIFFKDVTARKSQEMLLEKLLKQEITKQKMVARAVVDAQEKERAEIGKELHDNVNQVLSTAKLFLEAAKNNEAERLELMGRSAQNIHIAIDEIRSISRSLMPSAISDLGLIASINDLVENIGLTKALKIRFEVKSADLEGILDDKQKLMLFRIIQEQVNNVLRHAQASEVLILIEEKKNNVVLLLEDNGKGFDLENLKASKGLGLSNITSRADMFNGKVDVQTARGAGCRLSVNIPL